MDVEILICMFLRTTIITTIIYPLVLTLALLLFLGAHFAKGKISNRRALVPAVVNAILIALGCMMEWFLLRKLKGEGYGRVDE
jgi:uncharacterized membrane protein